MNKSLDRLYELLPVIHRQRDVEQGYPLRALLQVIAEQVNAVENDIDQLYENWFIETCQDWVVPYIGDLIGYELVHEAGEPGAVSTEQGSKLNKILTPRREVANTVRYRRRKGTLAALELLAQDVTGWSSRVVEYYKLVSFLQSINHLRLERGRTVDLRNSYALERINTPFDDIAHTADIRHIRSRHTRGYYGLPNIGLYVWRLRPYKISESPAYCLEAVGEHTFTFSVLGNDCPLYTLPVPEEGPYQIAGILNLPAPIKRQALAANLTEYYGENRSFHLQIGEPKRLVNPDEIVVANLSDWEYVPPEGKIAVDPEYGRIAFSPRAIPEGDVWVSYHYGFSTDLGGGEYDRVFAEQDNASTYQVGADKKFKFQTIREAIQQWESDKAQGTTANKPCANAVIEIMDNGVYSEQFPPIKLGQDESLQLRATNRKQPLIRLLDWKTSKADSLKIISTQGNQLTLDGLLISGRGIHIEGSLQQINIRHCTLVPGWDLLADCSPMQEVEPSLTLDDTDAQVRISHSIIGAIQIDQDEVKTEPISVEITDSVIDATNNQREAFGRPGSGWAHTVFSIRRSTVFGQVETHAIELADNCIFMGKVSVVRSQRGCMRFCYVEPATAPRTPKRFRCQPDVADAEVWQAHGDNKHERDMKRMMIRPRFKSVRYGTPDYCRLDDGCAEAIRRGADDQSEMGVYHDLFTPQREINLRTRLEEYTPAGASADIIYMT